MVTAKLHFLDYPANAKYEDWATTLWVLAQTLVFV
jgi:hypothetical protein